MAEIIIGGLIAIYAGYVIIRQIKNVKKGNYCGSCSGCSVPGKCREMKEN